MMESALHRLTAVTWPERRAEVEVLPARAGDREVLRRWQIRFAIDCGMSPEEIQHAARPVDLGARRYFLARDPSGECVSMAIISRETPNSACLTGVYTPDEQRGRGYASALVGAVSQRVLDSGKEYCTLFTDLANPTSNKIYHALGYRRIGDFRLVEFG